MSWRERILDLVYPPRCPFCARLDARGLCDDCKRSLPRTEHPLRTGEGFGKCAAPLRYEGAVREALLRLKFGGARAVAKDCGAILAECAAAELGGEFDRVTFVPVSKRRRRKRGYDQAELLARAAARLWDTEAETLLRKRRDNPAQSSLGAEARRGNVAGMYEPLHRERIEGGRILLIDDIITTGSTLAECARTLKAAGAASVVCACVASAEVHSDR